MLTMPRRFPYAAERLSRSILLIGLRGHVLAGVLLSAAAVSLPAPPANGPPVSAPDSAGIVQRLPNGLVSIIQRNTQPPGRVELRLVVRAGTAHESADQHGAAYLVAHVAVQETPHFPADTLSAYLETLTPLGVRADTLVQVSATATVYRLSVASDSAALARGLTLLADWARGVPITAGALELAHPMAIATHLGDDEPPAVVDSLVDAVRFAGVLNAAWPPPGSLVVLDTRTPAQVDQFEHTWYRPDNMAIVIVGDVRPQQAARLVAAHLAPLSPSLAGPVPLPPVSLAGPASPSGVVARVVIDPQASAPWVRVLYRLPASSLDATATPSTALLDHMYGQLLNLRLGAAAGQLHAHLVWATPKILWDQPDGEVVAIQAQVQLNVHGHDHSVDSAVAAVVTEVTRAATQGFTPAEVALVQQLSRPFGELSTGHAARAVHDVLTGVLRPGRVLGTQGVTEVTPSALQARAVQWAHGSPLIVVGLPSGRAIPAGLPAAVERLVTAVQQHPIAATTIDTAFSFVPLFPSPGHTLPALVQAEVAKAVQVGKTPVVYETTVGCENCVVLEHLLEQPSMRGTLQSMYIIRVNVTQWDSTSDVGQYNHNGYPELWAVGRDGQELATGPHVPGYSGDDGWFYHMAVATHGEWTIGFVGTAMPQTDSVFSLIRTQFQEQAPVQGPSR